MLLDSASTLAERFILTPPFRRGPENLPLLSIWYDCPSTHLLIFRGDLQGFKMISIDMGTGGDGKMGIGRCADRSHHTHTPNHCSPSHPNIVNIDMAHTAHIKPCDGMRYQLMAKEGTEFSGLDPQCLNSPRRV